MCFSRYYSQCAPEWATIKAFGTTDPFALSWSDLKDEGNVLPVEFSVVPAGWFGAVIAAGSKLPNTSTNTTNEGALLVRSASTGTRGVESDSSPLVGPGISGVPRMMFARSAASGSAWLYHFASLTGAHASYWSSASPGAPVVQGARVTLPTMLSTRARAFHQTSTDIIYGDGPAATFLQKWNSSGSVTATLAQSGLSVTGGRSLNFAYSMAQANIGSPLLVYGSETGGGTFRRLWLVSTSLGVSSAATVTTSTTEGYQPIDSLFHRPFTPDGNSAFLITRQTSPVPVHYRLKRIGLSPLSEVWSVPVFSHTTILCADNTRVYVTGNSTGDDPAGVTAYNVSGGTVAWSANNVRPSGGSITGRVISAGVAFFGGAGIKILNASTGAEIATIDTPTVLDVAEIGGMLIAVGTRRLV